MPARPAAHAASTIISNLIAGGANAQGDRGTIARAIAFAPFSNLTQSAADWIATDPSGAVSGVLGQQFPWQPGNDTKTASERAGILIHLGPGGSPCSHIIQRPRDHLFIAYDPQRNVVLTGFLVPFRTVQRGYPYWHNRVEVTRRTSNCFALSIRRRSSRYGRGLRARSLCPAKRITGTHSNSC